MNWRKNWVKIVFSVLLAFFIIWLIVFQTKKADFLASQGNRFYKKGNYAKAQEYYEKSYELGNKDTNFRKAYVNTLVNSPLTIDAQEKIVRFAEGEIQDSASESAKYFLRNLKKEIHNKYPNNYVKQAPLNNKIMHWGKMPITYTIKKTKNTPEELVEAVNDSFDTLERVSSVRIRFKRVYTGNADISVTFNDKKTQNAEFGQKYVIATTTPYFNNNKLEKMTIDFGIYNLDGNIFSPNQMYNTALHEVFHALGFMGHCFEKENIMYISKDNSSNSNDERKELSEADKLTLELFYKIKPDITNANELQYEYIPYLIIGDENEITKNKANEAKRYINKAPTVPAGYIDMAQSLLNQQKYAAAIANLEKALRLANDKETKYMVYFNLAIAHYYDGNYELSHIFIEKAQEYKTEDELKVLDAEVYIKEGNLEKGIKIYTELAAKDPNNRNYVIALANTYIKNKNYFKARKILKTYIKNNPQEKNNKQIKGYGILLRI